MGSPPPPPPILFDRFGVFWACLQVRGVAQAELGVAPPALAQEGERLRQLLVELGALGEPRPG